MLSGSPRPEYTGIAHRADLDEVAGDDPSPEADIDLQQPPSRRTLPGQSGRGDGSGHRVEGHVDDRGDTSGCGGSRGGRKTLPVTVPGVTHMDVGVDEGRHHNQIADVFDRRSDVGVAVEDVDDVAVFDHD
jgi:hypothetical protein